MKAEERNYYFYMILGFIVIFAGMYYFLISPGFKSDPFNPFHGVVLLSWIILLLFIFPYVIHKDRVIIPKPVREVLKVLWPIIGIGFRSMGQVPPHIDLDREEPPAPFWSRHMKEMLLGIGLCAVLIIASIFFIDPKTIAVTDVGIVFIIVLFSLPLFGVALFTLFSKDKNMELVLAIGAVVASFVVGTVIYYLVPDKPLRGLLSFVAIFLIIGLFFYFNKKRQS